ncbi:flagellar hook-basal body complex protein FliE [Rheinheimera sp. YQF-2]|jgi:flagellar hook-basal body complex protein FliE|uniref:Flagellar hook-basal body complex protein FliE n=1 Tax=Rheinheimera lutimaris TaxID=2740584 RepID=A0A7Y5AQX1_9GAMM|nr:flagellar hook-basal body complex protein FliE [Rheinheimera lutimaris]NRQ42897.1 flagellar hook-basal body complex protein FliE [Rheinheimera lutimaris]
MISPIDSQSQMLQMMTRMQQVAGSENIAPASNDSGISTDFTQVIRAVNQQQNISADLMTAVDTGRSDDVVGAMVASQKADLSFSMLLQVRNKVLSGIDDVMRMSL